MKRINNYSNRIYKLLGFQEYYPEKQYIPFTYCITKKSNEGVLLYNTLTRELLLLTDEEYYDLYLNNKLGSCEKYQYLIRHWFLISNDINSKDLCYTFRQIYTNIYRKKEIDNITRYTILTTTNCNARCSYCYEIGCNKRDMDIETANDVANYIVKHSSSKVFLQWFGGEPLCNTKVIDSICKYLKRGKIEYSSGMITNGYLINECDINKIKNLWKLKKVQITLDGTKDVYNKTKNFVYNDTGSFDRVLENIGLLLRNGVMVHIRLNISLQNIDEMHSLIKLLNDKFQSFENNLYIYSHPLFEEEGSYLLGLSKSERKLLYDGYTSIQEHIRTTRFGHWHSLKTVKPNHCMADNKTSLVITPEGNLSLCEHCIDKEYIGTIYSENLDKNKIQKWSEHYNVDNCSKCIIYPQCTKIKKCPVVKCTKEYRDHIIHEIQETMIKMSNNLSEMERK